MSQTNVEGPVALLAGTCPSVSFSIGGQRVVTNAGTQFEKIACADLRNAVRVGTEGVKQADGAIVARKVERKEEVQAQQVKVEGVVAALSGGCPNVSFSVSGKRIVTNAATRFEKAACVDLRNGMHVEVEGVVQADGAVVAAKVERDD